jgi:DNA-directed RNA polymerase specialized sigma24 family protein
MTEEETAEQAVALLRAQQVEQAALLLHRCLAGRMQRYFERHRVSRSEAEELVSDVWLRFIASSFDGRTRAVVWLWTVARSVLLDWVRAQGAQSRGRGPGASALEITLEDDAWALVENQNAAAVTPGWLKLCVERAIHQLEQDDPGRAHVLWLWHQGWSADEVAIHFGAPPPPSEKQRTAARNRVLDATRKARDYFSHCRD